MATEPVRPSRPQGALLAGLFFVSGAASLVDQVVWLRYLSLTFGNTTLATATLLAVFLGGLGAGAWWFGRFAGRLARPLTAYGLVELGVALWALATPVLFDGIDHGYVALYRAAGDAAALLAAGRTLLAILALAPPTFLMGASLPLLLAAAERRGPAGPGGSTAAAARATALLYGVNTLGAVAGAALAGFVTIRLAGLDATLLAASTAQASVALVAVLAARRFPAVAAIVAEPDAAEVAPGTAAGVDPLLGAAFFMGAASLAAEVLWTRILVFYLGSSVYAYSLMLVLFLAGVGVGALLAPPLARFRPLAVLAALEGVMALLAIASVPLFATLDGRLIGLSELVRPRGFGAGVLVQLLAVLPILLPATLVMGATFPLVVAAARGAGGLGARAGRVYAANTAGSIFGSLGAGFLLVPAAGSQNGLLLLGAVNGVLAWWFARRAALERSAGGPGGLVSRLAWAAFALAPLLAAPLFPRDRVILAAGIFRGDEPGDLVHFHEDAQAAVAVRRQRDATGPYLSLELNGVNVAGTSPDLYAVQKMQGHLPLLLGSGWVERVLHIGFGSGGTAHAVSRHPVTAIKIVEISPAVLAASDEYFAGINQGVLADPRVKVEINDGRNFLLATPESFDAILSDSIHPRYSGNGSLYTLEYFRQLERRLSPGGVASMWLPTYALTTRNYAQIVAAFRQVFPDTIVWYEPTAVNAFTIVTGRRAMRPWNGAALTAAFAEPGVAAALADLGIQGPADIVACYMAGPPELDRWLAGVPPHVDDLPAVEYESGQLLERDRTWLETFSALLALRPSEPPAALVAELSPAERERARALWGPRGELLESHRQAISHRRPPPRPRVAPASQ